MLSQEILAYVNSIELIARKLIAGPLSGDYRYKLKGSGFEFDQLRDYEQGDDVRFIDWKASARSQKMLVRSYLADRNRTVLIAIDVSASLNWGSGNELKKDAVNKLALLIAFASLAAKDAIGLILFSNHIELFLPPKPSRQQVFNIAKTLLTYEPKSTKTDINNCLKFIAAHKTKNMLVCLISDFMFDLNESYLNSLSARHEVIAFKCTDPIETKFPNAGILTVQDIETKQQYILDTNFGFSKTNKITDYLNSWQTMQDSKLRLANIDSFTITPGQDFVKNLVIFLRQRVSVL